MKVPRKSSATKGLCSESNKRKRINAIILVSASVAVLVTRLSEWNRYFLEFWTILHGEWKHDVHDLLRNRQVTLTRWEVAMDYSTELNNDHFPEFNENWLPDL